MKFLIALLLSVATAFPWTAGPATEMSGQGAANAVRVSGDLGVTDLDSFLRGMFRMTETGIIFEGRTLTVGGNYLGAWDYVRRETTTVSSGWDDEGWFTDTADSKSAIIYVSGDLTIDAGVTFAPPARKLFTVICVTGTLTVNGSISMTARGANHSASGSDIPAADIKIASGVIDGVTDPVIPAGGASGGAGKVNVWEFGNNGSAGSSGQTGGGAGGGCGVATHTVASGTGATGTSFSGGAGGGGAFANGWPVAGSNGEANGGAGGYGQAGNSVTGGGGAGNPPGASSGFAPSNPSAQGTGGTLIVFCKNLVGSGSVSADGVQAPIKVAPNTWGGGGGSSGGGSVTIITHSGSVTTTASGGSYAPQAGSWGGGVGGDGTARVLQR